MQWQASPPRHVSLLLTTSGAWQEETHPLCSDGIRFRISGAPGVAGGSGDRGKWKNEAAFSCARTFLQLGRKTAIADQTIVFLFDRGILPSLLSQSQKFTRRKQGSGRCWSELIMRGEMRGMPEPGNVYLFFYGAANQLTPCTADVYEGSFNV